MGRLDDAAKQKVVELRRAGLSFRKIKAELELENIKVSAQAIYLFLREFQGRPPGRARPLEIRGTPDPQLQERGKGAPDKWGGIHLQNLIRISSQQSHRSDFMSKSPNLSSTNPPGSSGECSSGSSSSSQGQGLKEENDIQIVSVTSLSQTSQNIVQNPVTRAATTLACSTGATTAALAKRRVSPSPTTNSMLAARKRILDKALSHRIKSFQQMASLIRRDQTSVQGPGLRNPVTQPSNTYNSNERAAMENQSEGLGGTSALHYSIQRPSMTVRSVQPPPRVGIRLPSQSVKSLSGISNLRLPPPPSSQSTNQNEGNSSPQHTVLESRVDTILQDQIQTLSSEVHSLGVAVKMLIEQQCRLEREQVQQTNIQKQILSTLQTMSSKMGCCSAVQQQQKTHSPAALKSTSFNQDSFTCSQGTYTQCSQSQPSFSSIDSLETVEPFKLPELSPTSMNGFATCSSAESLPLIPSPLYQQQNTQAQAHISAFTQSYVSAYNQSNNHTFAENKLANFSNSCAVRTFQDCNISTEVLTMSSSVQDQVNSIKVEGP
ncbi:uncharacterized protein LOC117374327 [Periophthalmus magnuspinnatus]|uniref:uncharacterized protein LOC117374327 n=1 Tax=Periophthalmus magnuspinnatus TaxID=409849 RepID=UPI00145BE6BE|nr:uncharacterized protein LOC117374327 [Periophthalmus magnuspinnatus]XP_055079835.1 uncharacterized protein LOC117374327 [Periophthalmus magnuspinnatus]